MCGIQCTDQTISWNIDLSHCGFNEQLDKGRGLQMNVLAEKQKLFLEKGISQEEYNKRYNEFIALYWKLRRKEENSLFGRLNLSQRKKIHKFILLIYKIKNRLGGFSYKILKNQGCMAERPVIFAVTHVGKFDIEIVSEAIKEHYYLLSGDFEHIQGIIDAPFLALNGVIYFNEREKEDRKSVLNRMVTHLLDGGNLMYFPEGTWNLTPNLPMLPCYWGIVEVAQKGNAIIIPVAAEQYGKRWVINIGKNIDINQYGKEKEDKLKAIGFLRDILATLKWEIWESEPIYERKEIRSDEWDKYVRDRFKEWPYFNMEYIDTMTFKPPI